MISSSSCQKAQDAFRESNYDLALEFISKCLASTIRDSLSKSLGAKSQQYYDAKFLEADIYIIKKELEKANEVFDSLKPTLVGDSEHISYLRAKTYYLKARIESANNNPLEYGDNMLLAKQHFVIAKLFQEAIDILFDLMDFNSDRISSNQIMELYEEIEDLSKKIKDKDRGRLNSAKAKLEFVKISGTSDDKVLRNMLNSAINDFSKIKHESLWSEAKIELAELEEKYDLEKSEKLIEEALKYISTDNLDANTSLKLASIKIMKGELEDGIKFTNSLDNLNAFTKNQTLARTLLNLGRSSTIHLSRTHPDLVEKIIKRCITVNEELDLRYGKGISYLLEGVFLSITDESDTGKNKLSILKILYNKLEKDISTKSWQTDLISFIARYEDNKLGDFLKNRNSELRDAEILFLCGIYLSKMEFTDDSKKLFAKSRDIFKKHTSKKNSINNTIEYLNNY